jgi:competence protein ComEA
MNRSPLTVVIWLAVAGLLVLVGMRLLDGGGGGGGSPVRIDAGGTAVGSTSPSRPGPDSRAVVHVAGAVRVPGLYRVGAGSRVAAALERAGGPSRRADLTGINLAARIEDGQQIVVPGRGTAGSTAVGGPAEKPSLGSASIEQLEELDGIGPALAERIVEYRKEQGGLRSVDDLGEVDGIGEKRLAALKESLTP